MFNNTTSTKACGPPCPMVLRSQCSTKLLCGQSAVRIQLVIMWLLSVITLSWQAPRGLNICCGPSSYHKSFPHQYHMTWMHAVLSIVPFEVYPCQLLEKNI